jgi:ribosomal protein S24E
MNRILSQLEAAKHWREPDGGPRAEKLLKSLNLKTFRPSESLIRVHDALLFLSAFPQSQGVVSECERLLSGISAEVSRLRASGAEMDGFDDERVSGIAGTVLSDTFTYEVASWLADRHGNHLRACWDVDEQARPMAAALPQFLPLLEDDSLVEADTPFLTWMAGAAGHRSEFGWLLEQIRQAPIPLWRKTELYDSLRLALQWELGDNPASRTLARRPVKEIVFHAAPLLRRNQVSLTAEFQSSPLPIRKLTPEDGAEILDMCRDAVTVRYRELYGTTRGDPTHVFEADPGRGVQIFLWGLPPDRRLPLRAYHAGFTLKNGVPINYIEGISLFSWMEIGFNTFYAYRDGETAWIYAKVLHFLHQLSGVATFSVYPYQLGHENEEAIQSGAFWFYRKLGFRPGRPDLLALAQKEERRIAADSSHRTSPATLRKLAAGHVFYEIGRAHDAPGLWDAFSTRNLGVRVQQAMAAKHQGNATAMREACRDDLARALKADTSSWNSIEREVFDNFAFALSLVPDLRQWSSDEKECLHDIIRAKAAPDETKYLNLLQKHSRLRDAIVPLGSSPPDRGGRSSQ